MTVGWISSKLVVMWIMVGTVLQTSLQTIRILLSQRLTVQVYWEARLLLLPVISIMTVLRTSQFQAGPIRIFITTGATAPLWLQELSLTLQEQEPGSSI